VRPNPEKDADRRRDIREWFEEFRSTWKCRFCPEAFVPILAVYANPTTCRPAIDLAKQARFGTSPEAIRSTVEKGVILCPNCKAKLACVPMPPKTRPAGKGRARGC